MSEDDPTAETASEQPGPRAHGMRASERAVVLVTLLATLALCTPLVAPAWVGTGPFGLPRAVVWVLCRLLAGVVALVAGYRREAGGIGRDRGARGDG